MCPSSRLSLHQTRRNVSLLPAPDSIISDAESDGLPTPPVRTLTKLHHAILEHNPKAPLPPITRRYASPSLVLLRLAILSEQAQGAVSSTTQEEVDRLVALTRSYRSGKVHKQEAKWAESARAKLIGLGAEWKAAAESVAAQ